eukprot:CAMPEP_0178664924 /NCGR_PEP_ID=MMETSP0698-20121128/29657_1 /TAXON_ID=265572 /ORGANISM="Extubocellulus spinifer, Strain CCMP396" /LENGTH=84 /DNA_ID=CAMNT_0020308159 /DNA_START=478 /DNA_END=729 /DNA_ORIENTATION=+
MCRRYYFKRCVLFKYLVVNVPYAVVASQKYLQCVTIDTPTEREASTFCIEAEFADESIGAVAVCIDEAWTDLSTRDLGTEKSTR